MTSPVMHRTGVRAVRWTGLATITLLVALGTLSLVAGFFVQHRTLDPIVVTTPVTRLDLRGATGDLNVHGGGAGAAVTIVPTVTWTGQQPQITPGTADGTLTVSTHCQDRLWLAPSCTVDLDVTVPAGITIALGSTTGDIRVDAPGAPVTATTSTGDITITGLGSATAALSARTGSIQVSGTGQDATVTATTQTGDIALRLSGVPRTVSATARTGDVAVLVPASATYRVDASTRTGDVAVRVPQDSASPHAVTATSTTGDVAVGAS